MIHEGLEFHNVAALEPVEGFLGLRMQRFPRPVRHGLGPRGIFVSQEATGCEVRFVTDAPIVHVTVSSVVNAGDVYVFRGDFLHSQYRLEPGVPRTLQLETPAGFGAFPEEVRAGFAFAPNLWRIVTSRYPAAFHAVDTFGFDVRPPLASEKPALRWLAYGSSITHSEAYTGYIHHAARRLGVDLYNNGMSGSCHCESAMADFLAARGDWDFATMELGVNMRGGFTAEEFGKRAGYLIRTMVERNPEKPIAVITVFPNRATYTMGPEAETRDDLAFAAILRDIVREAKHPNLHLIEGADVLTDFNGLSQDLIHPSPYGHVVMGDNLARLLAPLVGR